MLFGILAERPPGLYTDDFVHKSRPPSLSMSPPADGVESMEHG